jgi:hypothetical protein
MPTTTQRVLDFRSNAVTGPFTQPTMSIGDLAWSDAETSVRPETAAPVTKPSTTLLRAAVTSVVLGAISVTAALGVLLVDRSAAPRTMAVVDGTHSAPSTSSPSSTAPVVPTTPSVAVSAIPLPRVQVSTRTATPPTVTVSAPPVTVPTGTGPPPHREWKRPRWEHHWDLPDWDRHDDEPGSQHAAD